jgi:exosortase/archaeosortase family protein
MKPGGYALALLLALFIVGVPNAIRLHWTALGPHWARAAAVFVPGSRAEANHIVTSDVDVTVNYQCSGADNIQIFSMLFATVFFMNWKRMQGWKSVLLYLSALVALAVINMARIVAIAVRGTETHSGLSSVVTLVLIAAIVWKLKWLRPDNSTPAGGPSANLTPSTPSAPSAIS